MLRKLVEGLRPVIARAEPGLGGGVRPEGRRRTSVLQDALGPRASFRASNQSSSGLFRVFSGRSSPVPTCPDELDWALAEAGLI